VIFEDRLQSSNGRVKAITLLQPLFPTYLCLFPLSSPSCRLSLRCLVKTSRVLSQKTRFFVPLCPTESIPVREPQSALCGGHRFSPRTTHASGMEQQATADRDANEHGAGAKKRQRGWKAATSGRSKHREMETSRSHSIKTRPIDTTNKEARIEHLNT
jgi:hypothetical protein